MRGRLAIRMPGSGKPLPAHVAEWLAAVADVTESVDDVDALMTLALRARPVAIVLDRRGADPAPVAAALRRLKADSYTGIVPTVAIVSHRDASADALDAGADEVLHDGLGDAESRARLAALLRRADRDRGVHPTTRLPGTVEIDAELERRIADGGPFATCYADLDHFKEYNDRYGYNEGDRVIRMLALVLHDVVKGICGETGFVGHIGGDDFLFIVPLEQMVEVCSTIVETFEDLVPFQYGEADRRAGYYFGKDRRGMLHRVPLMSVSIGVVTTERRSFTRAAQVSALASEMKSYAKGQPGSGYYVDRRQDAVPASDRHISLRSEDRS